MNNTREIVFDLKGEHNNAPLSVDNNDIDIQYELLSYAVRLFRADNTKELQSPTFKICEGSVKNIFRASAETVAKFAGVLSLVSMQTDGVLPLDNKTAQVFEEMQTFVRKNNFTLGITTNFSDAAVTITPQSNYRRKPELWVIAEKYYYGKIVDAGGVTDANIHLDTSYGRFTIHSDEQTLKSIRHPLYNNFGVRVRVRQNPNTGEIDESSMELIELTKYNPKFDLAYLRSLQKKATPIWSNVDVDKYLQEVRGYE